LKLGLRRRLFFVVLTVLACWPLAHLILARKYLINPWELCGFAMYVQPNLPIEVRLYQASGEIFPLERLDGAALEAFVRYRSRAEVLGLLASTDEIEGVLRQSGYAPEDLKVVLVRKMIAPDGQWTFRTAMRRIVER
jgi:hypothetical protein